ncbi:hypothetical protein B0T10DRAFT_550280 [Thelonectria olida]|uniref:Uncharacterized protein n=1 Tax=Thelonectria olida TaxID=1576542 RepID=A0A9P9AM16_9HYPO|nr:hypothetical protein B0T10DRAFT_550280 [Thelonectria olida]
MAHCTRFGEVLSMILLHLFGEDIFEISSSSEACVLEGCRRRGVCVLGASPTRLCGEIEAKELESPLAVAQNLPSPALTLAVILPDSQTTTATTTIPKDSNNKKPSGFELQTPAQANCSSVYRVQRSRLCGSAAGPHLEPLVTRRLELPAELTHTRHSSCFFPPLNKSDPAKKTTQRDVQVADTPVTRFCENPVQRGAIAHTFKVCKYYRADHLLNNPVSTTTSHRLEPALSPQCKFQKKKLHT